MMNNENKKYFLKEYPNKVYNAISYRYKKSFTEFVKDYNIKKLNNMKNIKTFENFNNQDIFTYIKNNDIESLKNYIDSGYDLNIKDDYGYTLLIYVNNIIMIEIVKLLLNAGADINKQE